jgi:hypothetical protein
VHYAVAARVASSSTLLLVCMACVTDGPAVTNPAAVREEKLSAESVELIGIDAVFDSIGAKVPEFAGAFFRDGVVQVAVTATTAQAAAIKEVKTALRARLTCKQADVCDRLTPNRYDVRLVRNTWRDLVAMRNRVLSDSAFADFSTMDLDEAANVVVIGTQTPDDSARLQVSLQQQKISHQLLRVELAPLPEPTQSGPTLLSRLRPILGGLQIGPSGCTLAIVGFIGGQSRAITNSHCSANRFSLDYQQISQPIFNPLWGYEIFDPSPYRCGPWYNRKNCRRADQAAYATTSIDLLEGETTPFIPGVIALPIERVHGPSQTYGSLQIGSSSPIVATQDYVLQGENMERVGVTTGWQYGLVTNTCVDANYSSYGITIVCSDHAQTNSQPGDSGGPMFRLVNWDPSQLIFVGINHGRTGSFTGIFSNFRQMKQEIPGLCFWYGC